jgi:hypothetical protein
MNLVNILKSLLNVQKKIDVKSLPSQGLFYKDDFDIFIKKADVEDIIEYEWNYEKDDIGEVIFRLKRIVNKNVIISHGYTYNDIKSVDIVFIFLEIVKFTNNKKINIKYFDDEIGKNEEITFDSNNFNYSTIEKTLIDKYDSSTKEFNIDGFRYSLPCIGVENSLTNFLVSKSEKPGSEVYNDYSYDFLYFLGHKNNLSFKEIENLIQIFNFDMEDSDKRVVRSIVKNFSHLGKYSLIKDSKVIDVTAKIDLETIWK